MLPTGPPLLSVYNLIGCRKKLMIVKKISFNDLFNISHAFFGFRDKSFTRSRSRNGKLPNMQNITHILPNKDRRES